jgi:hypothetical protein
MAAEQLQIQVSANVSNAIKGLGDLEKGLKSTETAGTSLGNKGLPQVTKGANQANTAMINLGRTVSDAPFGFIGIANNIGPLVENFTFLRKEAGSTGGAFKQLGASLIGPGGLIVGIQLALAAVQFAQLGFSRWGASTKKAKEEQDKLAEGTKNLIENVTKQRVEFESLVKVARNVNQSEAERNQALTRLNEILPDTIGKLTQQNIATEQGAAIIQNYIKAVEARATAELLVNRIAENNVKLFDNRNKALQETQRIEGELLTLRTQLSRIDINATGRAGESAALRYSAIQSKINSLVKEQNNIQKEGRTTANELINLNNQLRGAYESQLPLVNDLTQKQTKQKEAVDEVAQILQKYREAIAGINWDEQNRGLDGTKERLDTALEALKEITLKGVKPTADSFRFLTAEVERFRAALDYKNFRDNLERINKETKAQGAIRSQLDAELQKSLDNATAKINNEINLRKGLDKYRENQTKKQIELETQLAGILTNEISGSIDTVFNSLERGDDIIQSIGESLKQLVIEITKTLVKMALLNALKNVIAPGLGSATGVANSAFSVRGDYLRNAILA